MKKSYSSLNILQEELFGLKDPKGLIKYLFTNRKYVTVAIPYYDYIRGKVFIEDLRNNFEDRVPNHFDFVVLCYLLYDDFLNQIKRGAKNEEIAKYLIGGYQRHYKKKVQLNRIMKPLTKNNFSFETYEEEIEVEEDERTAYLEIRMKESEILRAEVLIHDLEPFLSGIELTTEKLIAIIYLDFIQQIKTEGNSLAVQKAILSQF